MSTMTRELVATQVLDDVFRVNDGTTTVGYVVKCGRVYVSLEGAVYNTAVEVAQSLDLDTAVSRLQD